MSARGLGCENAAAGSFIAGKSLTERDISVLSPARDVNRASLRVIEYTTLVERQLGGDVRNQHCQTRAIALTLGV